MNSNDTTCSSPRSRFPTYRRARFARPLQESQEGIDNDDGSAYYESSKNFLVYSGNGMKSDFGG